MNIHSRPDMMMNTSEGVFYNRPTALMIDEDLKSEYSTTLKVETLIKELKEKGPLIAMGKIGPSAFETPPSKLATKIKNAEFYGWNPDFYGWNPDAKRSKNASTEYAIVLGAKKLTDYECVYLCLSSDLTTDQNTYIREHIPSMVDRKIYELSHENFKNYLEDLYCPTSENKKSEANSNEEPSCKMQ